MEAVEREQRRYRRVPVSVLLWWAIDRPGVEALTTLTGIEVDGLDDYDRVLHLQAWAACRNWLDAQLVPAVVAVAGATPVLVDAGRCGPKDVGVEEVRLALREGEGRAGALVDTARKLTSSHTGTRAAMATGRLGWSHAKALVDETAECTPDQVAAVEARCLPRAGEQTPRALRLCARRAVLRIRPRTAAEQHAEGAAHARVTRFEDGPGLSAVVLRANPVDAHLVWTAWDVRARALRAQARANGTDDGASMDIWRVRAAVDMAEDYLTDPAAPHPHGRAVTAVVVADLQALLGLTARPAQLRGHGPLPAPVAAELAATAGQWIAAATDGQGTPVAVQRYQPSQQLRDWIGTVWAGCAVPGCSRPRHATQDDHNQPYGDGGPTAIDNLDPLCIAHHQWKTDRVCHAHLPSPGDDPDVRRWWTTPSGHRYPIPHPRLLPPDGDDPPDPDDADDADDGGADIDGGDGSPWDYSDGLFGHSADDPGGGARSARPVFPPQAPEAAPPAPEDDIPPF